MRFADVIDLFVTDMWSQGRMNSVHTEREYRHVLNAHCDDVGGYDPTFSDRNDVKTTLRRWTNPNTQSKSRSVLVSFYDWCMEEGYRKDNPARQTSRPRRRPTQVYRLTRHEAAAMLAATRGKHETRAIHLGLCAGLRNSEMRNLTGRHFQRDGYVHVSADIAKGAHERWVPIIAELAPVAEEIRRTVPAEHFVLPAQRWRNPGVNTDRGDLATRPFSAQALQQLVARVGLRAGITAHIHPHLLRHAFGDHVAKHAGIKNAQYALGHANVATTETYVGQPTLDDLSAALIGLGYQERTSVPPESAEIPYKARTGVEPVVSTARPAEPVLAALGRELTRLRDQLRLTPFPQGGAA